MKWFALLLIFLSLPGVAQVESAQSASIDSLIADLGANQYPIRERANHELWRRGHEALPLLEKATQSDNPEISTRARNLARKIRSGIRPDSSPKVIDLIEKYDTASSEERSNIITKLKQLNAWLETLHLFEQEKDPETRKALQQEMRGVSIAAARKCLMQEPQDFAGALYALQSGPPTPRRLAALADFHRVRGSLKSSLKKAASDPAPEGKKLYRILLAVNGELEQARQAAEASGDEDAAIRYSLLSGNPLPLLSSTKALRGEIPPFAFGIYRRAITDLWQGKEPDDDFLQNLIFTIATSEKNEQNRSLSILYALGIQEEADRLLEKLSPYHAFSYYESLERIDDALHVIKLDQFQGNYQKWAEPYFEKLLKDPGRREESAKELFLLASFLECRGETEAQRDLFEKPMQKIVQDNPEATLEIIREIFSMWKVRTQMTAYDPFLKFAALCLDEEQGNYITVLNSLYGENPYFPDLWDSLANFMPNAEPEEKLRFIGVLLKAIPDTAGEFDKWWDQRISEIASPKHNNQLDQFALLGYLVTGNTNAERFLQIWQLARHLEIDMSELGQMNPVFYSPIQIALCALNLNVPELVIPFYEEYLARDIDPLLKILNTPGYAHLLRAVDKKEEAKKLEQKMALVILGDTRLMTTVATQYAVFGEPERALEWWLRAASIATSTDHTFLRTIEQLYSHYQNTQNWQQAAIFGELVLFFKVMQENALSNPIQFQRLRYEIEISRALSQLQTNREEAVKKLKYFVPRAALTGSLADYFFIPLRAANLSKLNDEGFHIARKTYLDAIKHFPNSHNTMNSYAWTAARANRQLAEAEELSVKSLHYDPANPAYLDTRAEIFFAQGDRENALQYSKRAVGYSIDEIGIVRQFHHFSNDDFPPP